MRHGDRYISTYMAHQPHWVSLKPQSHKTTGGPFARDTFTFRRRTMWPWAVPSNRCLMSSTVFGTKCSGAITASPRVYSKPGVLMEVLRRFLCSALVVGRENWTSKIWSTWEKISSGLEVFASTFKFSISSCSSFSSSAFDKTAINFIGCKPYSLGTPPTDTSTTRPLASFWISVLIHPVKGPLSPSDD